MNLADPRLPDAFVGGVAFAVTLGVAVAIAAVRNDGQLGWTGREDVIRIGVLVAIGVAMAFARSLDIERHQIATRSMSGLQGAHHA
jgi:hypothetical protein